MGCCGLYESVEELCHWWKYEFVNKLVDLTVLEIKLRSQDPIDPLKSLTISPASPQMSSIAQPARYARKST